MATTDLEKAGNDGTFYRVNVLVFDEWKDNGGQTGSDCEYWLDDHDNLHPLEGVFADKDEARQHALRFDSKMALDALSRGNGRLYSHACVTVTRHDDTCLDGDVILDISWYDGTLQNIREWDDRGKEVYR